MIIKIWFCSPTFYLFILYQGPCSHFSFVNQQHLFLCFQCDQSVGVESELETYWVVSLAREAAQQEAERRIVVSLTLFTYAKHTHEISLESPCVPKDTSWSKLNICSRFRNFSVSGCDVKTYWCHTLLNARHSGTSNTAKTKSNTLCLGGCAAALMTTQAESFSHLPTPTSVRYPSGLTGSVQSLTESLCFHRWPCVWGITEQLSWALHCDSPSAPSFFCLL